MRECPRCKSLLFDDMDVCYGCMYSFNRHVTGKGVVDDALEFGEPDVVEPLSPQIPDVPPAAAVPTPAPTPAPELCLCVDSGAGEVKRLPLPNDSPLVVGRSDVCNVRLRDPTVSRRHLQVTARGDKVEVADLGSSNPTYVDGNVLNGRALVALGACITIARARLWAEQVGHPLELDTDKFALVSGP